MRRTVFILVLSLLLVGCSSVLKTTEVPVYLYDTTEVVRYERDSIYIERWHTEYAQGDTVYRTDSVYAWRYLYKHDTTWVYRDVPVEVEKRVERELTWWQQFRLRAFGWIVLGVLCYVAWKTRRRWNVFLK